MLFKAPIEHLKSVITNFTGFVFLISALGLFVFSKNKKEDKDFSKEAGIGKLGSMAYLFIGIGFIFIRLFFL